MGGGEREREIHQSRERERKRERGGGKGGREGDEMGQRAVTERLVDRYVVLLLCFCPPISNCLCVFIKLLDAGWAL